MNDRFEHPIVQSERGLGERGTEPKRPEDAQNQQRADQTDEDVEKLARIQIQSLRMHQRLALRPWLRSI